MIFRIFPSKDTFITNDFRPPSAVRLTGANVGGSEELNVFKRAGASGVIGSLGSASLARVLMQFDLREFCALTASGDLPRSGLFYRLRMNHKTSAEGHPSSFDLVVKPLASGWDEGNGRDIELGDRGYANWVKRTSAAYWDSPGGDFALSPWSLAHFDEGNEDLDVDVTPLVEAWLSGSLQNNGIAVMLTSTIESDSAYTDFYIKKFYSRQTDFADRGPYLEARAADHVRDDRANMRWGRSGSLYLYNIVGGSFENLAGDFATVTISDSSGVLVHLTASRGSSTGIYSASFALATGGLPGRPYSGSVFYDMWGSGSYSFMTGTFCVEPGGPQSVLQQHPLTARIRNLQDEYVPEDTAVLEVAFRRRPHTQPVFQTASLSFTPYITEQAYYAIENDSTRERVVPFGTGSDQCTRLSYGSSGNFFKFRMANLHAGNAYRIVFLVSESGRQQIIDGGFKFKVV